MSEAELRRWVDAISERVNDRAMLSQRDGPLRGETPLYVAACVIKSLPLVLWLLDEESADVNATTGEERTALHGACFVDILNALLNRGADPLHWLYPSYAASVQQYGGIGGTPAVRPAGPKE